MTKPNTVWCSYNAVNFLLILTKDRGGWGCEVSCGRQHQQRGKTNTRSALDGAVQSGKLTLAHSPILCECILSWASGKLAWASEILYRTYKGHLFLGECSRNLVSHTAVLDFTQIMAYLVHNVSRTQLYLGFGHFGWLPSFFGQQHFGGFMVKLYFICWNYSFCSGWHICKNLLFLTKSC